MPGRFFVLTEFLGVKKPALGGLWLLWIVPDVWSGPRKKVLPHADAVAALLVHELGQLELVLALLKPPLMSCVWRILAHDHLQYRASLRFLRPVTRLIGGL